jgi:hypothetical protein
MNLDSIKQLELIIEQECELYGSYSDLLIMELNKPKQGELKRDSKTKNMNDLKTRNIEVKIIIHFYRKFGVYLKN